MDDKLLEYLIVTDSLDEFLGKEEKQQEPIQVLEQDDEDEDEESDDDE